MGEMSKRAMPASTPTGGQAGSSTVAPYPKFKEVGNSRGPVSGFSSSGNLGKAGPSMGGAGETGSMNDHGGTRKY